MLEEIQEEVEKIGKEFSAKTSIEKKTNQVDFIGNITLEVEVESLEEAEEIKNKLSLAIENKKLGRVFDSKIEEII